MQAFLLCSGVEAKAPLCKRELSAKLIEGLLLRNPLPYDNISANRPEHMYLMGVSLYEY